MEPVACLVQGSPQPSGQGAEVGADGLDAGVLEGPRGVAHDEEEVGGGGGRDRERGSV